MTKSNRKLESSQFTDITITNDNTNLVEVRIKSVDHIPPAECKLTLFHLTVKDAKFVVSELNRFIGKN